MRKTFIFSMAALLAASASYAEIPAGMATDADPQPVEPPYSIDFSTLSEEEFPQDWAIVNNTPDAGWQYSAWTFNKNGDMGAAFCQAGYIQDGDDWLISPPLNFKAGQAHVLFSTRSANVEQKEYLEIYVGRSLDTGTMQRVAEYTLTSSEWSDKAANFDIPEDGVYHVALRGVSPCTAYSFYIGDVTIGTGEFIGSPFIKLERLLTPYSNCDLSAESRLGMRVTNKGTGTMTSYSLTAYVNDEKYVTEFNTPVLPDETVDIFMDRTFDLSALGSYDVQLILTDEGDTEISGEVTIECMDPLTELPVITDFSHDVNTDVWQAMTDGAWSYEPMFEVFSAEMPGRENGLLSRGIFLSHPVRFKLQYMAPGWDIGAMAVYMGLASADPSTYTCIYYDDDVSGEAEMIELTVPVEAPGNYSFIVSDEASADSYNRLRLNIAEISEVLPYDLRLGGVEGSLAPYTPAKAVNGIHKYTLTVENRGSETMRGIRAEAKLDGTLIAKSAEGLTLAPGESDLLEIMVDLPEKAPGDSFELSFNVVGEKEDGFAADNSKTLPVFNVTESTFAHEAITDLTYGTGNTGSPLYVGYIYTLPASADATGMTVGFSLADDEDLPNVQEDVAFSVYKLNADGGIDRRIWSETRTRGMGGLIDVDFQDMRLDPGDYYFEVAQLSIYNMGIAYDPEGETVCYSREGDALTAVPSYPLCIRAQFAPGAKVYAKDAAATMFTAPTYTEGLYSESSTVKAIARNAGYAPADFNVVLTLDGVKAGEQSVSLGGYDEREVAFEGVDLSKPGHRILTATAILSGDENALNDSVDLALDVAPEAAPYRMDFENCADFDASGDPWNPRWTTFDRNGVETDIFWRYRHPHQGEPVGFMAFNIKSTVPSMEEEPLEGFYPHTGERFGVAFHINPWAEGAEGIEASDVWIISPKLQLGLNSEFELYVKTRMLEGDFAELEPYRILISETDAEPESFTVLGDAERLAAVEDWEKVTVDLSAYDGKSVHVALQYIGQPNANTCLMIDDLHVKTDIPDSVETVVPETPVTVNGHNIIAPYGSRVFTVDGTEARLTDLASGIYLVRTPAGLTCKVLIR